MSNLPGFDGRKLIKILNQCGFEVFRIKGSHHFLKHIDERSTVIPVHGKETIGIGLFYKILKDCEITVEEVLEKSR